MIGRTLLHYTVTDTLGEGGMGVVYKATDTHLDRFVALKVLPRERVANEERKRRFMQEAKAASALNHPNIVHIYDIATDQDTTFIAMEYVPGRTLAELIPRQGMPVASVLNYAVQIADGLAQAHKAGIIHRDLKPGNLMVGEDGRVRILDFGLAKLADGSARPEDAITRTSGHGATPNTDAGMVIGTAAYMIAPTSSASAWSSTRCSPAGSLLVGIRRSPFSQRSSRSLRDRWRKRRPAFRPILHAWSIAASVKIRRAGGSTWTMCASGSST